MPAPGQVARPGVQAPPASAARSRDVPRPEPEGQALPPALGEAPDVPAAPRGAPSGPGPIAAPGTDQTAGDQPEARRRSVSATPPPEPRGSTQPHTNGAPLAERAGCTAPQLRRFIKSRAYVPMHELRRRFAIEAGDDVVTPVEVHHGARVFIGLPSREGSLLGELLRSGDIGYELSLDPISPIVVGVFPMRPVPRT